jgi:HK97 family phage portal protein
MRNLFKWWKSEKKSSGIPYGGYGGYATAGGTSNLFYLPLHRLPQTRHDYLQEFGPIWANGAVAACVGWAQRTFPESPIRVMKDRGNNSDVLHDHPLTKLLKQPNPHDDCDSLFQALLLDYMTDGNAYLLKERSEYGKLIGLRWLHQSCVAPQWPNDGSQFISHYGYWVNGKEYKLAPNDVIHFKFGKDPDNPRLGMAPLKAMYREVYSDNEATDFTASLLKNSGTPGGMISPSNPQDEIQDPAHLEAQWKAKFTGDNRGSIFVASTNLKYEKVSFSPEELALDRIRNVPEARICSAFGIPPSVVGLTVGDEQKTYSNLIEARKAAYDGCIIPMKKCFANVIQQHLMPEMGNPENEYADWDFSEIQILQEDMNAKAERVSKLYSAGVITRGMALEMLELPFAPADNVYSRQPSSQDPAERQEP